MMSMHFLTLRLAKLEAKRPGEAAPSTFPAPDEAWWAAFGRIIREAGADGAMVLTNLGMSNEEIWQALDLSATDLAALVASGQETPDAT